MLKNKWLAGAILGILLMAGITTSCSEDSDDDVYDVPVSQQSALQVFTSTSRSKHADPDDDEEEEKMEEGDCFEFIFPISIRFPSGEERVVESEDEIESVVEDWETNNPQSDEFPMLVYPVTIVQNDSDTSLVQSESEIESILEACGYFDGYDGGDDDEGDDDEGDEGDDDEGDDHEGDDDEGDDEGDDDEGDEGDDDEGDEMDICIDIIFPISLILPDSTNLTVQDLDALLMEVGDCEYDSSEPDDHCPSILFPISVRDSLGIETPILNSEEFEAALEACD